VNQNCIKIIEFQGFLNPEIAQAVAADAKFGERRPALMRTLAVDARRIADDVCSNRATNNVTRSSWGGFMSNKTSLVLAATLVSLTLPALGQELPDGPGKELAVANCNT